MKHEVKQEPVPDAMYRDLTAVLLEPWPNSELCEGRPMDFGALLHVLAQLCQANFGELWPKHVLLLDGLNEEKLGLPSLQKDAAWVQYGIFWAPGMVWAILGMSREEEP